MWDDCEFSMRAFMCRSKSKSLNRFCDCVFTRGLSWLYSYRAQMVENIFVHTHTLELHELNALALEMNTKHATHTYTAQHISTKSAYIHERHTNKLKLNHRLFGLAFFVVDSTQRKWNCKSVFNLTGMCDFGYACVSNGRRYLSSPTKLSVFHVSQNLDEFLVSF